MKDKLWLCRHPVKGASTAIPKYFFLYYLVGYLKRYSCKLLLLFDIDHLMGEVPYFRQLYVDVLIDSFAPRIFLLWLSFIVFMFLVQQ